MILKFVEVSNGFNWGKFAVCRFSPEEWAVRSKIDGGSLLAGRGWTPQHVWILDLQTGEGAFFRPGGHAKSDLGKHQVWVCPMFEVFLGVFYSRPDWWDLTNIPDSIELTDEEALAASAMYGHRREGPPQAERARVVRATSRSKPV